MYDFENRRIRDGEPAFGLEDTFRIHDRIYVRSRDADDFLTGILGDKGYVLTPGIKKDFYTATKRHAVSGDEILDQAGPTAVSMPPTLIVTLEYADGHKHSLTEPLLHETILSHAHHASYLDWYNRAADHFNDVIVGRMSAFVENLVEVEAKLWKTFVQESQDLHAQDFIKSMASWASRHSDREPRQVRKDAARTQTVTVFPDDRYAPRFGRGGYHLGL